MHAQPAKWVWRCTKTINNTQGLQRHIFSSQWNVDVDLIARLLVVKYRNVPTSGPKCVGNVYLTGAAEPEGGADT